MGNYYIGPILGLIYFLFHFLIIKNKIKEFKFLLFAIFICIVVESTLSYIGFINYMGLLPKKYGIIPLWIIILWGGFSLTVFHSFKWILGRYKVSFILGGIIIPLFYLSGDKVGAIFLKYSLIYSYLCLSILWAFCFLLLIYVATIIDE